MFTLTVLGFIISAAWPDYALIPDDPEPCPRELYTGEALILLIRYLLEGTPRRIHRHLASLP